LYSAATRSQINNLIGRHINQATINGKFLDVQSMGLYIELLNLLTIGNEINFPMNLKTNIFPNPFTHQANIVFDLQDTQKMEVSLYNSTGKKIRIIDVGQKIRGTYSYSIEGTQLPAGMYFVVLQTENGTLSSKIIKQ